MAAFSTGAASAGDDLALARNRVGKLLIGMPENAIYKVYPRRITRKVDLQLEGYPTPAVQVFLTKDRLRPSLVIRLDGPEPGIFGIEVMDSRFRTANGLGVGSSFGELRNSEKQLSLVTGEGTVGAVSELLSITFNLSVDRDTEDKLYDTALPPKDPLSIIPDATKIESIWVHWSPAAK